MKENKSNGFNAVSNIFFAIIILFNLFLTTQAQTIKPAMAGKKISPGFFGIHPGILDNKNKPYFFYHNGTLPAGGSYCRSICADCMYYNEDGTIQKIIQTIAGVEPVVSTKKNKQKGKNKK